MGWITISISRSCGNSEAVGSITSTLNELSSSLMMYWSSCGGCPGIIGIGGAFSGSVLIKPNFGLDNCCASWTAFAMSYSIEPSLFQSKKGITCSESPWLITNPRKMVSPFGRLWPWTPAAIAFSSAGVSGSGSIRSRMIFPLAARSN